MANKNQQPQKGGEIHEISDDLIEKIAEKAAERALQKVYAEVGKNVVRKTLWFIGSAAVAILLYFGKNNISIK